MRRLAPFLLVVIATGAGAAFGAAPAAMVQSGCVESFAAFPVPIASIMEPVPEGFAVGALDPLGLVGARFLVATSCAATRIDGEEVGPVVHAALGFLVTPPPALTRADVTGHGIFTDHITDSPAVRDVFLSWGIPSRVGAVSLDAYDAMPAARVATTTADGSTSQSVALGPAQTLASHAVRAFGVSEGHAASIIDVEAPAASGVGTIGLSAGGSGAVIASLATGGAPPLAGVGFQAWGAGYGNTYFVTPIG